MSGKQQHVLLAGWFDNVVYVCESECGARVPKSFLLSSFLLFGCHQMDGSMFHSALDNVGIEEGIVKELMQMGID